MNDAMLGVMIDCSRNSVLKPSALKKLMTLLAKMGYNSVQLYTEDTFEAENEPYFGYLRGRYSAAELQDLDAFAATQGIELVPCVNMLAHLNQIFRWAPYREINDMHDILLVGEERTYELIENIFRSLAADFRTRKVHIGMDEAHMLGMGKYFEKHGPTDRQEIMLSHLTRVAAIAEKYGFTCMMWSDMFFRLAFNGAYDANGDAAAIRDICRKIPHNVRLVYWDYYSVDKQQYVSRIQAHQKLGDGTIFAGGCWTWVGLAPLNAYSLRATEAAVSACRETGVKDMFFTMWGDNGGSCSPFSVLPSLVYAACLAQGNGDMAQVKAKFREIVGMDFDAFMALDLPNILPQSDENNQCTNASKYLLYNDVLLGIFDTTLNEGDGEIFRAHARKLAAGESNSDYGFIFKPLRLLCECLYYKADLGIVLRRLYKASDKAGLKALCKTRFTPLIKKLEEFYDAFVAYWDTLFKPHGFDVMDVRIGGLIRRIEHCAQKVQAYVAGKTDRIPELEEQLLDVEGKGTDGEKGPLCYNNWAQIVSANII